MADKPQNYANHKRINPIFHFLVSPVMIANVGIRLVDLFKNPSFDSAWAAIVAAALAALAFSARSMALILQNRLISLEEKTRLARILPDDLRARVPELRLGQLIALRFASDAEAPALMRRSLAGEFSKNDDLKRAITDWRPDTLRV